MKNEDIASTCHTGGWFRILCPLLWWLLLVLMLLGIHTHERLLEKTRLKFTVTLQGQPLYGGNAALDGQPVSSGQKISLGAHQFVITHPKGVTYSTNLFIWYGGIDLGGIDLPRATGMLSVTANPLADTIRITGPEFSTTLTNSPGMNLTVPTDAYQVEASYRHWQKRMEASVFAGQTLPVNFAPQFGTLQLDCNQSDATYQLQTTAGQTVVAGLLPALTTQLAAGDYALNTWHHGHSRTVTLTVKASATNAVNCDFQYGTAIIETSPAGATVIRQNQNWGETPLRVYELLPGEWQITLQKSGYQPLDLSLVITANQTNVVSTNLLSETYLHALNTAQNALAAEDFDRALAAADAALTAKPNDIAATALQQQATGLSHLQRAKTLALANDFVAADKALLLAQASLPDNAEIKNLLATYQPHEPAQIERERVERLARPKKVFDDFCADTPDADLFDSHELTTTLPAKETMWAVVRALQEVPPFFHVSKRTSPLPETYAFSADQSDNNVITTTGKRQCLIVIGRASDTETQIHFRVIEYKSKHNVSMPGLLAFKDNLEFLPLTPSRFPDFNDKLKTQVEAGVSNVTARIQGAIKP